MDKYRVSYWVEYEVFVEATAEDEAIDKASLIPENQWATDAGRTYVELVEETE